MEEQCQKDAESDHSNVDQQKEYPFECHPPQPPDVTFEVESLQTSLADTDHPEKPSCVTAGCTVQRDDLDCADVNVEVDLGCAAKHLVCDNKECANNVQSDVESTLLQKLDIVSDMQEIEELLLSEPLQEGAGSSPEEEVVSLVEEESNCECVRSSSVECRLLPSEDLTIVPLAGFDPECDTDCDTCPSGHDPREEARLQEEVEGTETEQTTDSIPCVACQTISSVADTFDSNGGAIDQSATSLAESESELTGKKEESCEDFSVEHPHDVHVAIINGPMSDSRSDDLDAESRSHGNSMSSLANADDINQNDDPTLPGNVNIIESFDEEDDVDPELLEVNHLQAPEQEIPPLFKVGPSVTAECEICLETNILFLRLCCGTPICDQCMTTYLESVIRTGKVKIECPGLCQQKYIHRDEIIGRISLEMKEKYCKFLIDANNEPHIKTCPRCSHVLQVELSEIRNPRVKKKGYPVTCPECQLHWCFSCQAPWHEGITCKEHRKGNKLLRKWAKQKFLGQFNAQRCPKCRVYIQRITGCDHMTCSKCDTSFCYRCGERYLHLKCIGDHYSRLSIFGCKYIYKPDNPLQRKLVRGSIFGAKLLAAPVVGVLAVGVGSVLLSGALIFFLPCYGIKKFRKHREEERRRRASAEEYQRWRRKLEEIHSAGDPYIAEYNRLHSLGVSPARLVTAAQAHQEIRGPSNFTDDNAQSQITLGSTGVYGRIQIANFPRDNFVLGELHTY